MQRADTTARKWNASKPSYDEGWSDDEELDGANDRDAFDNRQAFLPLAQQKMMKAPWEPDSNEDLQAVVNARDRPPTTNGGRDDNRVQAQVNPATAQHRWTYSLEDSTAARAKTSAAQVAATSELDTRQQSRPQTPDRGGQVDESATSPRVMQDGQSSSSAAAPVFTAPFHLEQSAPSSPARIDAGHLETQSVAPPIVVREVLQPRTPIEQRPASPQAPVQSSVSVPREEPVRHLEEPAHFRPVAQSTSNASIFGMDEQLRLQALMFNPDNMNFDQYSDDEDNGRRARSPSPDQRLATGVPDRPGSTFSGADGIDHDAVIEDVRDTPSEDRQSRRASSEMPSYPSDFSRQLKSRALSDAILETMHTSPVNVGKSISTEDVTRHSAATAERTPSVLLSTNVWAEKNRLLKEQLGRNKLNAKDESSAHNTQPTVVRASTYDHEYEYQPALPRGHGPVGDHADSMSNAPQMLQPSPNLNTLIEEEEDDENEKDKQDKLQRLERVVDVQETIIPPTGPKSHAESEVESSGAHSAPLFGTSVPSRAPDLHKSLPPVRPESDDGSTPMESHSGDDSDVSVSGDDGEEDDAAITAEQEYALLQHYQESPPRTPPAETGLPPILMATKLEQRRSLPPVQTQSASASTVLADEYTPSLYSARPSAQGDDGRESDMRRQDQGRQDVPFVESMAPQLETVPEEASIRSDRPISKSWMPLNTSSRNIPVQSPSREHEQSRFSVSTTQSADADEYRFDMRDTFNPAMLGTLEDTPYSDNDDDEDDGGDVVPEEIERREVRRPGLNLNAHRDGMQSSMSVVTIQPPLRHMESYMPDGGQNLPPQTQNDPTATESERLADELINQLSNNASPRTGMLAVPVESTAARERHSRRFSGMSDSVSTTETVTESNATVTESISQDIRKNNLSPAPNASPSNRESRPINRSRSGSAGSKFLEIMSPMTSMEQDRAAGVVAGLPEALQPVYRGESLQQPYRVQSTVTGNLMAYKDIKQMPSRQQRTAEYQRRTRALQESSNGLREYLVTVQARLRESGRELPAPPSPVEFKPSRSILPEKFVPHDLTRQTVRLGDRGKDAAKVLLSKSTKGFKGLFHSNSRSNFGSSSKAISAPLESNGRNRTPSMIDDSALSIKGTRSASSSTVPQPQSQSQARLKGLFAPKSSHPAQEHHQQYHHQQQQHFQPPQSQSQPPPPRLVSPLPQSPVQSTGKLSIHPSHQPPYSPPPPQSPAYSEQDPTITRIKSYFPDTSSSDIERALQACDGDEQRAIGFLVVNNRNR